MPELTDTRAVQRITYASLKEAFGQNTETVDGGHVHWVGYTDSDGTPRVCYQQTRLAAPRAAFQLHHGRDPIGKPLPTCRVKGCIAGGHLADRPIREASQRTDAVRAEHQRPAGNRPRPTIVCACCGETREHRAHGWCQPCYRRWCYRGRPVDGPPPVRLIEHDDVQGTVRGWDLHTRRKERACDPCRKAHAADMRARYGRRKQPLAECGTEAAFQRHVRHGEEPRQPCRDAYNTAQQNRYAIAPSHLNKRRHYTEATGEWSPGQKRAAVAAADRATGPDDCRLLLEALGLAPSTAPRRERVGSAA